eukprot:364557-Chlamydomonas_euryale.AAC.6
MQHGMLLPGSLTETVHTDGPYVPACPAFTSVADSGVGKLPRLCLRFGLVTQDHLRTLPDTVAALLAHVLLTNVEGYTSKPQLQLPAGQHPYPVVRTPWARSKMTEHVKGLSPLHH